MAGITEKLADDLTVFRMSVQLKTILDGRASLALYYPTVMSSVWP